MVLRGDVRGVTEKEGSSEPKPCCLGNVLGSEHPRGECWFNPRDTWVAR